MTTIGLIAPGAMGRRSAHDWWRRATASTGPRAAAPRRAVAVPSGVHDAAEATYDRLAHHKGRDDVTLDEVIADLLGGTH